MYGLAAGVWTLDVRRAHRVARFARAPSGSTPIARRRAERAVRRLR
jgi:hypothetical protein